MTPKPCFQLHSKLKNTTFIIFTKFLKHFPMPSKVLNDCYLNIVELVSVQIKKKSLLRDYFFLSKNSILSRQIAFKKQWLLLYVNK